MTRLTEMAYTMASAPKDAAWARPRPVARRRVDWVSGRRARGPAPCAAFTLIELLVVVAIIAILAAIAVPNFLEAQTRAKTSRVRADMRTLAVGFESYCVDHNQYPPRRSPYKIPLMMPEYSTQWRDMSRITTPVAYLTSLPMDIFDRSPYRPKALIEYLDPIQTTLFVRNAQGVTKSTYESTTSWLLMSVGPDGFIGVLPGGQPGGYPRQPLGVAYTLTRVYDPTNGTASVGNIFRFAGGQDAATLLKRAS